MANVLRFKTKKAAVAFFEKKIATEDKWVVGACIALLGVILCLIGGGLLIVTFATQLDDDTDGPHFYGPGGTVI